MADNNKLLNKKYLDALLPKWSERVVIEMTGQDPLGLSRVSDFITDSLLSGITVQTHRARYYLSFCWALWHMQFVEKIEKYNDYTDSFRRKEALIALCTLADNQNSSPVGIRATKTKLEKGIQDGFIDLDFKILPSNSIGAYKQYYSGSIYKLGLSHRTDLGIDYVTESGKHLAEAYHFTVQQTPYIKNNLYNKNTITIDELNRSKRHFSINTIRESIGSDERQRLIEIFFGFKDQSQTFDTLLRRQSITLILYIISEYHKNGYLINVNKIDWRLLFPVCYYGVLNTENDTYLNFKPLKQLELSITLWRQFCLHEFLTQSLERLLFGILEVLESESNSGMGLDEIVATILQSEFYNRLMFLSGKESSSFSKLLQNIGINNIPDEKLSMYMQGVIAMNDSRSEAQILAKHEKAPDVNFAEALFVISILYGKWRGLSNDDGFRYLMDRVGSELWIRSIFSFCDRWLSEEFTWENLLKELIITFILDRHDEVMWSKNRIDSCWLHYMDDKLFKDQDYQPTWHSSRFASVVNILLDLLLVEMDSNGYISITKDGKKILGKSLNM